MSYYMEVMRIQNKKSLKTTRYYLVICGVLTRISKARYDEISNDSDGAQNLFTNSAKNYYRHFTTYVFYGRC